ncbi:MAG: Xaa-Pro peptidase family protein [Dehalococcoidales bacterium]|nr:Xaa-Pro peptidase family protein [Dehalococcoidales bacterium]
MIHRIQRLRHRLNEKGLDGILITQQENRRYLSGFDGSAGYLIISARKAVLATDFRYTEQALGQASCCEILRIANNLTDWFPALLDEMGIRKLGFEASDVSYHFYQQLVDALKRKGLEVEMVATSGLVEAMRAVKEAEEIEFIRKAAAIADGAYMEAAGLIRPGLTEKEIAWALEKATRERGSETLPFEIIVASGARSALPHAKPSDKVVEEGEPVVIDMGARYRGYACDMTRTVCAGRPDETFMKVYTTVLKAQEAAINTIRAGMMGKEADGIARGLIEQAGYGEAFGHSLGHGVGLAEHELPRLSFSSEELLQEGMVFTVEPGIYISGWGGVRIEDTVVLKDGRAEPLTRAEKLRL